MTNPLLLAQAEYEAAIAGVTDANERHHSAERALYAAVRDELLTHFNPAFVWSEGMQAKSNEVYLRCAWDSDRSGWRATIRTVVGDEDRRTTFEWAQRGPDPKAAAEAVLFAAYLDIGGEGLAVDTDDLRKIERVIWRDPSKPYVKPASVGEDPS